MLVGRNDAEKLIVTNADFEHGLQFDVKPAFGISEEQLDRYVFNGSCKYKYILARSIYIVC